MKLPVKKIVFVSYLRNEGVRRLCLILGILFALVPTYFCVTRLYVNKTMELRDAVVHGSLKQQQFVFEHHPYKCNFCDLETDFEHWRATFGSWKYTNDLRRADCSKLREPGSCNSSKKYLAQKIKINYYNFSAFLFLFYALALFYVPFLVACVIQWIVFGFQQEKKKNK